MSVHEMLATHPRAGAEVDGALERAIGTLLECAQSCTACADACLAEDGVAELRRCITLDLDCADVCTTTARVLTRLTDAEQSLRRSVLQACVEACRLCGDECERHAEHHEHCRVCAESCRRCEQACREALASLPA